MDISIDLSMDIHIHGNPVNSPKDGWMASDSRHFKHANSGYIMKGQRSKNDSNTIVMR